VSHLDDLAEHFMADDELTRALRSTGSPPGDFLSIGRADPDAHDTHLHVIGCGDRRFAAFDQARNARPRHDRDGLHLPNRRGRVMSVFSSIQSLHGQDETAVNER
jgi:hypothetical protein